MTKVWMVKHSEAMLKLKRALEDGWTLKKPYYNYEIPIIIMVDIGLNIGMLVNNGGLQHWYVVVAHV